MGQINTYQRSRLASSAVGVTAPSTAGSIIGESASKFGTVVIERQQALDKVQATNAFYSFAQNDKLNNIQTRQDNLNDPQGYLAKYEEKSNLLAEKVKQQIPDRLHGIFDTAVNKYRADNSGRNQEWVFDRENRNAIDGVYNFAKGITDTAITWTSPDNYIKDVQTFSSAFDDVSKVLTPNSAVSLKKEALRSAADMYWAANTDINTGDPIRLARDLDTDTGLKEMLIDGMGAAQFEKKRQGLDKVRAAYIDNVAWKDLLGKQEAAVDYFISALDESSPFRLAKAERDLTLSQNRLIKLRNDNDDKGSNNLLIENEEKNLRNLSNLRDYVARGDEARVVDDPLVKAQLYDDIAAAVVGDMSSEDKKDMWADVPRKVSKDNAKANRAYTDYIKGLATVEAKTYAALGRGEIKASTAEAIIRKITVPLKTLEKFDRLSTASGDYVSTGYNQFNKVAENLLSKGVLDTEGGLYRAQTVGGLILNTALGGPAAGALPKVPKGDSTTNLLAIDKLRSDMFSQYMLKMNEMYNTDLPVDIPMDISQGVMKLVSDEFAKALHPQLSGVALGGTFKDNLGRPRVFTGFDQLGNIQTDDPTGSTDKALGNI